MRFKNFLYFLNLVVFVCGAKFWSYWLNMIVSINYFFRPTGFSPYPLFSVKRHKQAKNVRKFFWKYLYIKYVHSNSFACIFLRSFKTEAVEDRDVISNQNPSVISQMSASHECTDMFFTTLKCIFDGLICVLFFAYRV